MRRAQLLAVGTLVLGLALGFGAGCGVDLPTDTGTGGSGPVCFQDSDCVPNGCCGRGTGAVHVSEAPDCSGVACDGSCPANEVNCGCGIPVCSDSHCTVAVTTGPNCPSLRKPASR